MIRVKIAVCLIQSLFHTNHGHILLSNWAGLISVHIIAGNGIGIGIQDRASSIFPHEYRVKHSLSCLCFFLRCLFFIYLFLINILFKVSSLLSTCSLHDKKKDHQFFIISCIFQSFIHMVFLWEKARMLRAS